MPNWVYNNLQIGGDSAELARFMDLIGERPEYADEHQSDFSFHSFITPTDITVDEYRGTKDIVSNGVVIGKEGGQWYEWNNANWNTKWDASDQEVAASVADGKVQQIDLHFNTAWSQPTPVFHAMSKAFPTLDFHIHWEEEQGYGEEFDLLNEVVCNYNQWDVPESHADYVNRDNEGGCNCAWADDKADWYDDCPGKEVTVFTVEVVTKYVIKAASEELAKASAEAEESGLDLPEGVEVRNVEYASEYRVVNVETEEASE